METEIPPGITREAIAREREKIFNLTHNQLQNSIIYISGMAMDQQKL